MREVSPDSIPSGLVRLDATGLIVEANSLVSTWSGIPETDLRGQKFEAVVRPPDRSAVPGVELLPAVAEIVHPHGSMLPVLVAEGEPDSDGFRYVTLFDAREQRAFRERIQAGYALTQRTQTRLELVIGASISFAEATSEEELAEVLAATTTKAYAAEESVVFLLDEDSIFRQIAGSNPFVDVGDAAALAVRAMELRTVLKISGVEAAFATAPAVGAAFEASGVQSMIIAPIHQGQQPLGILAAFFHHHREFDEQASPLADALAGQAARAISALRFQNRLEHAAMHDDTTGLPNRRLLEERIETMRRTAATVVGVLFVDLDGFKNVNDQMGHPVGDEVLREVAERLEATVRAGDIVARYGGDEFVIVCEVADENAAVQLAQRVRESIHAPYSSLPTGFSIGASIGVSVTPTMELDAGIDRLVRTADQAMYAAKHAGGDRIVSRST